MKNDENLEQEFEKLVRKAEEESMIRQKKVNYGLMIIESVLQLSGILIVIYKLGWLVGLGLFMWTMGNNLQNSRNSKKK